MKAENILDQIGVSATPRNKEHVRKLIEIFKMLKGISGDFVKVERDLVDVPIGRHTEYIHRWNELRILSEGDKVTGELFVIHTKTGIYKQTIPINNDLHREFCAMIGAPVLQGEAPVLVAEFDKEQTKFIKKALAFCSTDQFKPAMHLIKFEFGAGSVQVIATDGHKLLNHALKVNSDQTKTVYILGKNLSGFKGVLQLFEDFYQVDGQRFKYPDSDVISQFPDYSKVWPKYEGSIEVFKNDLIEALKPLRKMVDRVTKSTKFYFNGGVNITAVDPYFGHATESRINYLSKTCKDFKIAFNLDFLLQSLEVVQGDTVRIGTDGDIKPILLNDSVLLCPFRILEEETAN